LYGDDTPEHNCSLCVGEFLPRALVIEFALLGDPLADVDECRAIRARHDLPVLFWSVALNRWVTDG
jgi:hypothetical protein